MRKFMQDPKPPMIQKTYKPEDYARGPQPTLNDWFDKPKPTKFAGNYFETWLEGPKGFPGRSPANNGLGQTSQPQSRLPNNQPIDTTQTFVGPYSMIGKGTKIVDLTDNDIKSKKW